MTGVLEQLPDISQYHKSNNQTMRIYKSFQAYGTYLDSFYAQHTTLRHASYLEQLSALREDCFPWILSWSKFNIDSSVEIFETIHNAFYLQQAWSNNAFVQDSDWMEKIVLLQIKSYRPDVCVIYPPELFDDNFIEQIRSTLDYDVLIGGYDGMNRLDIEKYRKYDFVLTCSDYICNFYRSNHKNTYPLEFGFDVSINSKIKVCGRPLYNIGFNGSIYPVHIERLELIKYFAKHNCITLSSEYGYNGDVSLLSKKCMKHVVLNEFSDYYSKYKMSKCNIGPKYGIEMFQFLRDSAISLNIHGNQTGTGEILKFAANVRLYEATGVGSCLLTDWKENISEIFIPGKEVETFKSKEEALDKAKFLLKNERVRKQIANNGQKRTLSDYTYENRIKGVIQYIKSLL